MASFSTGIASIAVATRQQQFIFGVLNRHEDRSQT
jgi:hypothetical protein